VRYAAARKPAARTAQLLEKMGRRDEAREIYEPGRQKRRQRPTSLQGAQKEWADVARAGLKR